MLWRETRILDSGIRIGYVGPCRGPLAFGDADIVDQVLITDLGMPGLRAGLLFIRSQPKTPVAEADHIDGLRAYAAAGLSDRSIS